MAKLKVFVQGLRGLGAEVCKNLLLAGPSQVVICDNNKVSASDLASNFYLKEEHVGTKTRAEGSFQLFSELNENVKLSIYNAEITADYLKQFDVAVFTEFYDKDKLIEFNNAMHSLNKGFIYTGILGLYGFGFVDYGEEHPVFDATGEQNKTAILANITQEENGLVSVHAEKRHGFEDDDTILFKEVKGMEEVNGQQYKIKVKTPFQFYLNADTRNFKPYERDGVCE